MEADGAARTVGARAETRGQRREGGGARLRAMLARRIAPRSTMLWLACALAACGNSAAPQRARGEPEAPSARAGSGAPTAPTSEVAALEAAALEAEAEEPAPPSLWPEAPLPLAGDLARAETLGACAARVRGALTAEVAEAIEAFGYDRFVEDVCGGLAAVRAGDVAACDGLSVSSARNSCRRRLALVHGRPDACPDDASVSGREPVCLAWAARDAGLCRGAAIGERERCEAVLAGEARRCGVLPPSLRARCTAEASRYGAALGRERATSAARDVEAMFALTVTVDVDSPRARVAEPDAGSAESDGADAAVAAPVVLTFTEPTLERGVVVARCADGLRARIGDARRHGSVLRLDGPPEAELLLRWLAEAPSGPVRVSATEHDAALRLRIPHANDATSDPGGRGEVTLEAHGATRGALLAGTVTLTMLMPGGRGRVTGGFRTFVRDVLDADADECAR